jgi:DNA-binding MarR family transcriptional regulator
MPSGYGVGDGAALHFVDADLVEVVSSRPDARARYVTLDEAGRAVEEELSVRYLGEPVAAPALVMGEEALAA